MRALALAIALSLAASAARAEFYVNGFAGVAIFDSTVTVGGVKLIDQGGDALLGGLRVGYGVAPGDVYGGIEIEGYAASGRSRAVVNGDVYSWSLRGGVGAYGRLGWRSGDALFFGRAGLQYVDSNRGWESRPVVGTGAEVPIGPGWVVRIDGDYSWSSGPEIYRVTLGISRRF